MENEGINREKVIERIDSQVKKWDLQSAKMRYQFAIL